MAKVLLSLILLLTFITATAAELSCDCVEESSIHQEKKESKSESAEHKDHCQHTCTQCHFAAVVPQIFHFKSESTISYLEFLSVEQLPVQFSKSHFRPPIA